MTDFFVPKGDRVFGIPFADFLIGMPMKIAIPIFGARIAPRFDCAPWLLLITIENGRVVDRAEVSWNDCSTWQRIEQIQGAGAQTLVCGAIDGNSARLLAHQRIRLIPWVAGEVEQVLEAFLKGRLETGMIFPPRCRGRQLRWGRQPCRPKKRML